MSLNSGPLNSGPLNAPVGAGPITALQQIPLNLSNALAVLPVEEVPLNLASHVVPGFELETVYDMDLIVEVENFGFDLDLVVEQESFAYQLRWGVESADIVLDMGLLEPVFIDLNYPLAIQDFDIVEVDTTFDMPLPVFIDLQLGMPLLGVVENEITLVLGLAETAELDTNYPLAIQDFDRVDKDFRYIMPLPEESPLVTTGALTLTIDATGEEVPVISGNVSISEGSYLWGGSVKLFSPSDLNKFAIDEPVTVSIYGEDFLMLVVRKSGSKTGTTNLGATLSLQSRTVIFSTPRADPTSLQFTVPTFAQAAAEAFLGTTIDWQIIDWLIPAGRLSGDASNPVELAQRLAKAAGGTLESNPDSTLYVRDLYPTPVVNYPTATPAQVYDEGGDILSFTESTSFTEVFNKIRIRDSQDSIGRDNIELEFDENGLAVIARVYTRPDRDIELEHTSDANIAITDLGIEEVTFTDEVEFTEGKGSLNRPILAIDSVVYFDDDLGAVSFVQFESDLAVAGPGLFGLADITWRAKARVFRVTTPVTDKVQLLVCDPT